MATVAQQTSENPHQGTPYVFAGAFALSLQDVIIKWISGQYPVYEILFIRSLCSMVPILFIVYLEGGFHKLKTNNLLDHLIRSIVMLGAYTCFYLSLASLPLAEMVSLFFSAPIFIMILSIFCLGEKVEPRSWFAVFFGFLGVIIMLRPTSEAIDPAAILAVVTAVLYAIAQVLTRRLGKTESGASLSFYLLVVYITASIFLGVVFNKVPVAQNAHPSLAFLLRDWTQPPWSDLLLFMPMGLLTAIGIYCLSQAYRLSQPSTIAPFEYIAVPLSAIWGYLFWKDLLDLHSIIGMVMIVGSGLYIYAGKKGLAARYVLSLFKINIRR